MKIFGFVLTSLFVLAGIYTGGGLQWFLAMTSLILVVFLSIGMFLTSGSSIAKLVGSGVSTPQASDELDNAIVLWGRFQQDLFAAAWISVLIGLINMGALLDDYYALAPGVATALIAVFYAHGFVYMICRPVQRRLEDARALGPVGFHRKPRVAPAALGFALFGRLG